MKGNRAKGKSKESRDINLAFDNIKAQIIKHYQRISAREAFVTAEMVRNAYQGIGTEYETLLRAFDSENEAFAKRVGKGFIRVRLLDGYIIHRHQESDNGEYHNVGWFSLDCIKATKDRCTVPNQIDGHSYADYQAI